MNRKLPPDAYAYYCSLPPAERSYEAVAEYCNMSERAVADAAKREHWQERIADQERRARDRVDEKMVESIAQMSERHLKVLKFIEGRSIETMKEKPLDSCFEAMKMFLLAMDKERLIRGEPTDRTENFAEICKSEYSRWLKKEESEEPPTDLNASGDPQPEFEATPMSAESATVPDAPAPATDQPEPGPRAVDDPDDSED
jgi:hypothetical protein